MSDVGASLPTRRPLWRSARWGMLAASFYLIVGIPLFVRMPLWCDATLYQTAAQVMMKGGVHYRDVFDTNPPGFPLALRGIEKVVGTSSDAIRIADLVIFGSILFLAGKLVKSAGGEPADRAWMVAGAASFYLFITEYCHLQRDVWIMLPALAATLLRVRRIGQLVEGGRRFSIRVVGSLIAEGAIWAVGCWIKPHIVLPAALIWFLTSTTLFKRCAKPLGLIAGDALGIVLGTLPIFGLAVAWLIGSGAWDAYLDINRNWNRDYLVLIRDEFMERFVLELFFFPPWSILLLVGVPLAMANLIRPFSRPWSREGFARSVLAGLFFSWALTALALQRKFDYAHVPEILLMIALFAANRWMVTFCVLLLQLAFAIFVLVTGIPLCWSHSRMDEFQATRPIDYFMNAHSSLCPQRTRHWFACLVQPSRETRRGVGLLTDHFGGIDPVELGAVADYLKTQNVKDRELIAWHDSPHALYPMLTIEPGIRFMHMSTVETICHWNAENPNYQRLKTELAAAIPQARFVVSDMHRVVHHVVGTPLEFDASGLPVKTPDWQRGQFPLNLPVVYRSPEGRYLVHRIDHPMTLGDCKLPEAIGTDDSW